jgi:predicted secreted protein with PEFG-CTERM motif
LTWNPPLVSSGSAIQGYKIESKTSDSQYSILVPNTGNTDTVYLSTGLVTGTTYTYRVSAINGVGSGVPSNDDSAVPQKTLTPVIVGNTVISSTQVNLSWLPPSETIGRTIEGYRIDQLVGNTLVTLVQDTKTVTSYTISNLVTNQKYTFEVTALFLGGSQSNPSPWVSATTTIVSSSTQNSLPAGTSFVTGQQAPGPLYTVQFSNPGPQTQFFSPTGSQVNGIWATVSTYIHGAILYFDSGGVTYSRAIDPNSNTWMSFSIPLTVSNIRMSIQDRGYSNDQASISLILSSGNTQYYTVPDPPSGLSSTQIAGGNVQLSWNAPSNYGKPPISGYKLEYQIGSSGTWSVFSQNIGLQTIYIPSGLSSGTTYTFRVSAINSVGTSQPSTAASLTMGYNGNPIPTVNQGVSSGKIPVANTGTSISYLIAGDQLNGANLNIGLLSLNFQLQGSSSGVLYLNLPRDLIDSKNSDGTDKNFYIFVDNSNAQSTEIQTGPYRTLAISFPANAREISIIGTHVVPEFPIAMLGLGAGLIPAIFFSRKFVKF